MEQGSPKAGFYALGVTALSVGGLLTLTIVGAVVGVPLMILGTGLMIWGKRASGKKNADGEQQDASPN